jgi:carboxymethylenebutenolidase
MTIQLIHPDGLGAGRAKLTRRSLAAGFFIGFAPAALAAAAKPIHTDSQGLVVGAITYPSAGFTLPAYVARPARRGRFPVVIVVNEVFGIHDYIKDVCRRLAKLGYAAIAPAFFARAGDPAPLTDFKAIITIVSKASDAQVMGDVGATLAYLKGADWADTRTVAITGFCWGGGVVWLACEQFAALKAGVAWYGRMAPADAAARTPGRLWPIDAVDRLSAPVLGLYGAKDALAAEVPAMRAALAKAGKTNSQIIVYPDAGHGFHADYRDSYIRADADDGWKRMLAFFAANGVAPKRR